MTSPAIYVHDLRKSYRNHVALAGLDLQVEPGEILALLGPNGAGKTTTVEICAGQRRRDGGRITVLGCDPQRADGEFRERIGIVGQSQAGTFAELTVAEVIGHFRHYYRAPRGRDELIAVVGLEDKATARVRQLSGGQRRRLDVALGVVGRPALLFLDEPTTGFDPEARRHFWVLVRRLALEGTTVLLTTHYLEEAQALADRVAVIVDGRVVATGTAESLADRDRRPADVHWLGPDGPRSERTKEPTRVIAELTRQLGGEIPGLTVTRPTLEDVYLELIGAS